MSADLITSITIRSTCCILLVVYPVIHAVEVIAMINRYKTRDVLMHITVWELGVYNDAGAGVVCVTVEAGWSTRGVTCMGTKKATH